MSNTQGVPLSTLKFGDTFTLAPKTTLIYSVGEKDYTNGSIEIENIKTSEKYIMPDPGMKVFPIVDKEVKLLEYDLTFEQFLELNSLINRLHQDERVAGISISSKTVTVFTKEKREYHWNTISSDWRQV